MSAASYYRGNKKAFGLVYLNTKAFFYQLSNQELIAINTVFCMY